MPAYARFFILYAIIVFSVAPSSLASEIESNLENSYVKKDDGKILFYAKPRSPLGPSESVLLGVGSIVLGVIIASNTPKNSWPQIAGIAAFTAGTFLTALGLADGTIEKDVPYIAFSPEGIETTGISLKNKIEWKNIDSITITKHLVPLNLTINSNDSLSLGVGVSAYFLPVSAKEFCKLVFDYQKNYLEKTSYNPQDTHGKNYDT